MDDILDDLARCAARCERSARVFESDPIAPMCERLAEAARSVGRAWSGSWIGYHSYLYTEDLLPPPPYQQFDVDWGPQGDIWYEFEYEPIEREIMSRADVPDLAPIRDAVKLAQEAFEQSQQELIPTLDALLSEHDDLILRDLRKKIELQPRFVTRASFIKPMAPTSWMTRDSVAMSQAMQGLKTPHHIFFSGWLKEQQSHGLGAQGMARFARHAENYLKQKYKMKGRTMAKTDGKIFIGHGRSLVWRDLKDFIQDRLGLAWDEFNREPTAGMSTKERLEAMLDNASFAFLVMTAEDEHADATLHARENVVHEVGLFQGRLGFRRSIVLLEEGCKEFSNITGLTQIHFPKGNLMSKSEELRRVLEREGILK